MAGERVEVRRADDGEFYYVHVAANGEDLEVSESHPQKHSALEQAGRSFPGLPVEDETREP